ncbi:transmembrane and immunoglobulin domain-containing protein 2 isoform X2 [Dasypus novemcinctus]|uniref:transmembrane and immunoglobulin domain-containing protein 2 isoform X2 n=1 Tax=Dasypus novemcinctus TaxID=9361 RepID=UPI00265E0BAF|nr:transmembrane and immunoglobulin domain-containing protein 2 isoform X2 [Dasypus novemcinctus]
MSIDCLSHSPLRQVGGGCGRKSVEWEAGEGVSGLQWGKGGPEGPGMGTLGTALVLLVQVWGGPAGLSTRQEPPALRAGRGSQVNLSCQVSAAGAWEQLRVRWTKDGEPLCHLLVANGSLGPGGCGARGRLSWRAPGHLSLLLEPVGVDDSGEYVCWAAVEIPELEQARGNGTWLLVEADGPRLNRPPQELVSPGLLFPLVAGGVAVAALALGTWFRGRRRCRPRDSGHPVYCNVLVRPQGPPKKSEAWPGEAKALGTPRPDKKNQSVYSISFARPPSPHPRLPPKPGCCPRPPHPASPARVSPTPGPSGEPRPRGTPEVGRGYLPQAPRILNT